MRSTTEGFLQQHVQLPSCDPICQCSQLAALPMKHGSGSWVSLTVDFLQALDAGVRVDLRGAYACVSKQFLHGAKVRAAVDEVGGKGVTERVCAEIPALRYCIQ